MATVREKLQDLQENARAAMPAEEADRQASRGKEIVRTSLVGIIANVILAAFKAVVGMLSGSIAIVLDAVNNLSDAASSVITIVGTKLAAKDADKKHPFGYGRIEYLSAMIISVIVLYAGVTSLTESVKKIIHPEKPDYSLVSLIIVGAAVAVKIVLGRYVEAKGHKLNSDSLINSGKDATMDSVISASTLAAALIYILSGFSLEAILGAVISAVIIKSGIEMLRETISKILGEGNDPDLAVRIKKAVLSFPEVSGVYDLVLNNYGPDVYNGSLHIEVPDTLTADQLDVLLRKISMKVYQECSVVLMAIGVYSLNTKDPEAVEARNKTAAIAKSVPHVLQVHGFHIDREKKQMRFDLVISFDAESRAETCCQALKKVQEAFPDYALQVTMDTDFAEE